MKVARQILATALCGALLIALTACSVNVLLWGPEDGRVIDTTEQLIAAAPGGEQGSFVCDGVTVDFGDASDWDGLSAGEPGPHDPTASVDRPGLDASWRINLEIGAIGIDETTRYVPSDVFFRETATDICVADIIWQTVDFG